MKRNEALIDFLILMALGDELEVVLEVLNIVTGQTYEETQQFGPKLYLFGAQFVEKDGAPSGQYSVALGSNFEMAGAKMARFAQEVMGRCQPQVGILTGIAAAVKIGDVGLGDVVAADQVFSYENVAVEKGQLIPRRQGYQVHDAIRRAMHELRREHDRYREWQVECQKIIEQTVAKINEVRPKSKKITIPVLEDPPQIIIDLSASGPFLIRDSGFRDQLGQTGNDYNADNSKVIWKERIDSKVSWAEMEAYGFMETAAKLAVPAIPIKGVSDLGDEAKNRIEHETNGFYRAFAAANAIFALLKALASRPIEPIYTNKTEIRFTRKTQYAMPLVRNIQPKERKGKALLGFSELVLAQGPLLNLEVQIQAWDSEGHSVLPERHFCEIKNQSRSDLLDTALNDHTVKIQVNAECGKSSLGAALLYPRTVNKIKVRCEGPFSEVNCSEWRAD